MSFVCAAPVHVHVQRVLRITRRRKSRGSVGYPLWRVRSRDVNAVKMRRGAVTAVRATEDPASFNQIVLQAGPLLLPLVLSTSAAVYRSSREGGLARLPLGMWGGMSRLAVLAGVPERHLLTCEVIARLYIRHCTAPSRQSIARSTEETDIAALAVNSGVAQERRRAKSGIGNV